MEPTFAENMKDLNSRQMSMLAEALHHYHTVFSFPKSDDILLSSLREIVLDEIQSSGIKQTFPGEEVESAS